MMQSLLANLRAVWQPAMYHGHGRKRGFFEGWYFKMVSADERHAWAVIPGVFLQQHAQESHAFVQTLNGNTGETRYHRYPLSDFWAATNRFDVRVGPNHFTTTQIHLDLPDDVTGTLKFEGLTPWPVTALSPGIMGWYSFVPFMECYHGVLGLDHSVRGALTKNGATLNFDGGRGYIEKDWGQAFPRAWVWMQTNHFASAPGTSLTASIAWIPWLGTAFRGFIVGLWHGGRLYRFATYTGARTTQLHVTADHVNWTLQDANHTLEMVAERASGGVLHAPVRTEMSARVLESLTASVQVTLRTATGQVLFSDTGHHAGLEVSGEL